MRVLVTGGKGDLGRLVVPRLLAGGHEVLVGTRTPQLRGDDATEVSYDYAAQEPLEPLLEGVDTVVHLASDPTSATADVEAMQRLTEAAAAAGAGHLLYVSIVGIDGHPFRYYRAKVATEEVLMAGEVPWTILRATQFHSLVGRFAEVLAKGPVALAPARVPFQPLDPEVVADRIAELVATGPSGRADDLGGPQVLDFRDTMRRWLRASGSRKPVLPLPLRGHLASALRRGDILAPGKEAGGRTFDEYLAGVEPRRPDAVGRLLALTGWAFLAIAAWMALAPQGFVAGIASFGPTVDHFVRDLATFTAPLGVALILAARRPAWRVPVLGLAILQNGLHLVNHLVDVATTDPGWHGPVNLAALALLEVWLVAALVSVRRHARTEASAPASARAGSTVAP